MTALDVVVGRQPIFDRDLSVFGYELLFRRLGKVAGPGPGGAPGGHPGMLTAEVLFGSVSIGIDRLVGTKKLFCNAGRDELVGTVPVFLPPERTVIEVLESVVVDDEVLAGCRRLRAEGFSLALDDFSWSVGVEALLDMASIVKIDVQATTPAECGRLVERCREFGTALVAEKVETVEEFRRCDAMGFDYFQGFLLSRTRLVPGRALDPARHSRVRMASRLLDAECSMVELEGILRSDPAMVHQLLQLAGTAASAGMRREVRTVREALVLVGWRRLQSWVSLLMITDKGQMWQEEITSALTRARTCELAAVSVDPSLTETAFAAGMISCFGTLLGARLDTVLSALPIDGELRQALLTGTGPVGKLVADVTDYLLGRPDAAVRSGLGEAVLSAAALEGLRWAVATTSALEHEVAAKAPSPPAARARS